MKRPKTPINNIGKKSTSKKSPNNNKKMNQIHFNYSVKPSNNIFKQVSKGKSINNYYSPISRNNKIKINRAITPNNELLKTKYYNNNKLIEVRHQCQNQIFHLKIQGLFSKMIKYLIVKI